MSTIKFTKAVASGNDFVIIENYNRNLSKIARIICERKFGIGADGLLVLGRSLKADFKMRIFNPDGSEAEMCGNGLRCAALYNAKRKGPSEERRRIETKAGFLDTEVRGAKVKARMVSPRNVKLAIPLKINNRFIKVNFIDTGVPHTVIFVEGLDKIDVVTIGRQIRFHSRFKPRGTNVDFVEIADKNNIKIRTYERGVENETLACGTGSAAAAIMAVIANQELPAAKQKYIIKVHTESGEILKVYFYLENNKVDSVYLEGQARIVYQGQATV